MKTKYLFLNTTRRLLLTALPIIQEPDDKDRKIKKAPQPQKQGRVLLLPSGQVLGGGEGTHLFPEVVGAKSMAS